MITFQYMLDTVCFIDKENQTFFSSQLNIIKHNPRNWFWSNQVLFEHLNTSPVIENVKAHTQ